MTTVTVVLQLVWEDVDGELPDRETAIRETRRHGTVLNWGISVSSKRPEKTKKPDPEGPG